MCVCVSVRSNWDSIFGVKEKRKGPPWSQWAMDKQVFGWRKKKLGDTSVMQKIEASEKHRPDLKHEGRYKEHVCSISSILFHLMGQAGSGRN